MLKETGAVCLMFDIQDVSNQFFFNPSDQCHDKLHQFNGVVKMVQLRSKITITVLTK